jgi:hypothetical protein
LVRDEHSRGNHHRDDNAPCSSSPADPTMKAGPDSWGYASEFLKVPRFIVELLALDAIALTVYMVLLGRARYVPGAEYTGHGIAELDIGEAVCGRAELAAKCGTTEAKVRVALERLKRLSIIAIKTTKRGTVVKMLRYEETYPVAHHESPTESPTNRQAIAMLSPSDSQAIATKRDLEIREGETGRPEIPGFSLALEPPAGKRKRKKSASTALSESWSPREHERALALELCLDVDAQARAFRNHAEANGRTAVNWDAAFRMWLDKAPAFAARRGPTSARRVEPSEPDAYAADASRGATPWSA